MKKKLNQKKIKAFFNEDYFKNLNKLKGLFSQRWLNESYYYYYPLFDRLTKAQSKYLYNKGYINLKYPNLDKEEVKAKVESEGFTFLEREYKATLNLMLGMGEFDYIEDAIDSTNRGFINLLKAGESLPAMALIRLQLENLTYIYAEFKHPFRVLSEVFKKGKALNDIEIKKTALSAGKIREEIDKELESNVRDLYKLYSGYIHPSIKHRNLDLVGTFDFDEKKLALSKDEIKILSKDMITVNRLITQLIKKQIQAYNTKSH